jgi:hypothetical protein
MTVSLIQTMEPNRLDIAFFDGQNTGEVEGYVLMTSNDGDKRGFTPFNLDNLALADEFSNPVLAGTYVLDNYCEREVVVANEQIVALEAQQLDASKPDYVLRSLPRRIESAIAYRDRLLAGERGFPN